MLLLSCMPHLSSWENLGTWLRAQSGRQHRELVTKFTIRPKLKNRNNVKLRTTESQHSIVRKSCIIRRSPEFLNHICLPIPSWAGHLDDKLWSRASYSAFWSSTGAGLDGVLCGPVIKVPFEFSCLNEASTPPLFIHRDGNMSTVAFPLQLRLCLFLT
jgi:hypothetical protein